MRDRKRFSRVFIEADLETDSEIVLPTTTAHYLMNVLRKKKGSKVILFNGQENNDYLAEINTKNKHTTATIVSVIDKTTESPISLTLLQAIGKSDHMDFLIQKASELGVTRFVFFNSERTQHPIKHNRLEKKLRHWRGITISACEQCGRNRLPEIKYADSLNTALDHHSVANKILLDFEGQSFERLISEIAPEKSFSVLTGAEGGLTTSEIDLALGHEFKPCLLGPRTLRMETAAVSIVNLIQHRFGDMR